MKKKLAAVLIALCMIAAAGCGGKEDDGLSGNGVTDGQEENGDNGDAGVDGGAVPGAEGEESGNGTDPSGQEGGDPEAGGSGNALPGAEDPGAGADSEDPVELLTLRIVDGAETGNLVLAGEGAGEVYTLSVAGAEIYLDGGLSLATVLEDGMLAEIRYTGGIMETFPAQIGNVVSISVFSRGTEKNPMGTYYDLCGLYLQVLNDLWDVDSGLNGGAAYVSVDLTEAPGDLTPGEKAAVAWIFAGEHGAEALTLTYQELAEQGYLTEYGEFGDEEHKAYEWTDGVLFSITKEESGEKEVFSLPVLKFDAEKWRSPLGAYFFVDCKAVWAESGSWGSYSVGAEAIS